MTDDEGLAPANPGVIKGLHEMSESRNPLRDPRDRRIPRVAGPCVLVMFGVTGDLARKKLMPAIYDLANRGLLPPGFSFVGFARRDWEDEDFAQLTYQAVKEYARTPFRDAVLAAAQRGRQVRLRVLRRRRGVRPAGIVRHAAGRGAGHRRELRVLPVDPARPVPDRGAAAQAQRPVRPLGLAAGGGWSSRSRSATTWPAPAS